MVTRNTLKDSAIWLMIVTVLKISLHILFKVLQLSTKYEEKQLDTA